MKTIQDLENFPYASHTDLQIDLKNNTASLLIDRSVAVSLVDDLAAKNGIIVRGLLFIIASLVFVIPLFFLIFVIVQAAWWWILAIPVFIPVFFIVHPGFKSLTGKFQSFLIFSCFVGLYLSLYQEIAPWLFIAFIVMWASMKFTFAQACGRLEKEIITNEYSAVSLWENRAFKIRARDGQVYDVTSDFEGHEKIKSDETDDKEDADDALATDKKWWDTDDKVTETESKRLIFTFFVTTGILALLGNYNLGWIWIPFLLIGMFASSIIFGPIPFSLKLFLSSLQNNFVTGTLIFVVNIIQYLGLVLAVYFSLNILS